MPTYSDFWFRIILKIRSWWYIIHNIWTRLIVILHQYPGPNTKLDQHSHFGAKCGKDESEFSITIQNEPHLLCKANLYVSSPLQYNINQQKIKQNIWTRVRAYVICGCAVAPCRARRSGRFRSTATSFRPSTGSRIDSQSTLSKYYELYIIRSHFSRQIRIWNQNHVIQSRLAANTNMTKHLYTKGDPLDFPHVIYDSKSLFKLNLNPSSEHNMLYIMGPTSSGCLRIQVSNNME